MKIALLSKADASGGGASRVAEELCQLLNTSGHTAHHYVAFKQPGNNAVRSLYGNFSSGRIFRRLNYYVKKIGFPELIPWELFWLHLAHINQYDVLHFHDLSSAISPLTVRYLARKIPTVWTFHDCSPFTGGCLYPMDCTHYQTHCEQCPQLGTWPIDAKMDFTGFMQNIKRKTAAEGRFKPVTPSAWMSTVAFSSGMFNSPPTVVPNGVNTDVFKPVDDRTAFCQENGVSVHRPIILLTATHINEERKGVHLALQALRQVKSLKPVLLVVGYLDDNSRQAFAEFDIYETGYVTDNVIKSQYFTAADVHLFSSLADNLPLTILETMSCATPTVGFATGGVAEMVEHHRNGYLVSPGDVIGLVQGLHLALANNQAPVWGRHARLTITKRFSEQTMLKNYLEIYTLTINNFSKLSKKLHQDNQVQI